MGYDRGTKLVNGRRWSSQRREAAQASRPGPVKFELVTNLKAAKALGLNCLSNYTICASSIRVTSDAHTTL
jgi:hypothetical protein